MVVYMVEDNFEAPPMSLIDEIFVLVVGTESWINAVQIRGSISVVAGGAAVFKNRVDPNGRDPQVLQIVQSRSDTFQIPAVSFSIIGRIEVVEIFRLIVFPVSVGELIGSNQINNVLITKSSMLIGSGFALQNRKYEICFGIISTNLNRIIAGRQAIRNFHVQECVVTVFRGGNFLDNQLMIDTSCNWVLASPFPNTKS